MSVKNLLYMFVLSLLLSGCSYTLVDTQKLDAVDAKLAKLEEKISHNISKDLELKLQEQDEKIHSFFEESRMEQNASIQALNSELTTLIKEQNRVKAKRKPRPKIVNKVVNSDGKKLIVGSVEKVHIYPSNLVMNARIDTGAETSSIHADNIVRFERDGKKWVRFSLLDEKTNKPYLVERKVVRGVKILQSSQEEGYERRVIVMLEITIGDKKSLSEFTLTSRNHMTYPILIGRNVLQDLIIVDVSEKYMVPLVLKKEDKFKK